MPDRQRALPVRVALCGIRGKMGRELAVGLAQQPDVEVVGGCDIQPASEHDQDPCRITSTLAELLPTVQPTVVVDFTVAEAAAVNAVYALEHGIPVVIGTTGLMPADLERIDTLAKKAGVGALVAPNFAIGANLLLQFARVASRFMDAAEIIEIHHDAKADAPSGTALMIAQAMRESRGKPFARDNVTKHVVEGARGGVDNDLHIHSLRMQGFVATHQVIFGGPGQSLTLRHDSIGRESFLPGVAYAVTHIQGHVGLVYGLDRLIGFS